MNTRNDASHPLMGCRVRITEADDSVPTEVVGTIGLLIGTIDVGRDGRWYCVQPEDSHDEWWVRDIEAAPKAPDEIVEQISQRVNAHLAKTAHDDLCGCNGWPTTCSHYTPNQLAHAGTSDVVRAALALGLVTPVPTLCYLCRRPGPGWRDSLGWVHAECTKEAGSDGFVPTR